MAELFETAFPEPSSFVGYGRNPLVRDSENRTEESLPSALDHPDVSFQIYSGNKILVREDDAPTAYFDRAMAKTFEADFNRAVLLGTAGETPRIAIPAAIDEETLEVPLVLRDFRSFLYRSPVDDSEAGCIAQGGSLLAWNASHFFCGRCGTETLTRIGGYRRDCPQCDHKVFPRTDPAVIMLAIRGDKCLLGRSPHFPAGWYSTLAGFVEPGETIEDAVRRETQEESGIAIGKVRYHASQPWPFPHSLMIGAFCEALGDDVRFDATELEDCRWFSREEVRQMLDGIHPDELGCPPEKAIAHALIRAWAYPDR